MVSIATSVIRLARKVGDWEHGTRALTYLCYYIYWSAVNI